MDWTTISRFFDFSFWQAFVSGTLATLTGVIIGIPIALWLGRRQERSSEKEHKNKILRLLTQELTMDYGTLLKWHKANEEILTRCTNLNVFLKTEFWKAFSDGGELQWIKDPVLLSEIAEGYNFIRMMLALSERYFELLQIHEFDRDRQAIRDVELLLESGIPNAIREVEKALASIEGARKAKQLDASKGQ